MRSNPRWDRVSSVTLGGMSQPTYHPIRGGGYRAEVSTTGASLIMFEHDTAAGVYPLVTEPTADRPPLPLAGSVCAPWPDGVRDGSFIFDGIEHQLVVTDPDRGAAPHGFTWHLNWNVLSHTESRVDLGVDVGMHTGWPYQLRCAVAYEIGPWGLEVTHAATNIGGYHAPFGMSSHLYLRAGEANLDECALSLSAGTRLPLDRERSLPNAYTQTVSGTDFDFTAPSPLRDVHLDAAFSALDEDIDGRARHRLRGPDGRGVELWTGSGFGWLRVITADLGEGCPRELVLSPATCPPDAFNLGIDLIVLQPGQTWNAQWGLTAIDV